MPVSVLFSVSLCLLTEMKSKITFSQNVNLHQLHPFDQFKFQNKCNITHVNDTLDNSEQNTLRSLHR